MFSGKKVECVTYKYGSRGYHLSSISSKTWEVNTYDKKKMWVDSGVAKSMESDIITTADVSSISGTRLKLEG